MLTWLMSTSERSQMPSCHPLFFFFLCVDIFTNETKFLSSHLRADQAPETIFSPSSLQKSLQILIKSLAKNSSNLTMAPKTSFGKRPPKELMQERRIKAWEDHQASSSMPSSSSVLPAFVNKIIAKGRCLTFDFLEQEGFQFGTNLRNLGLESFFLSKPLHLSQPH